jgi:antitoxin PrlF
MDVAAKVTSKGQVTLPKTLREALGVESGDEVMFRVEGDRAILARMPNFLQLAGTVAVPAGKGNVVWDDVLRQTREARAHRSRLSRDRRPGTAPSGSRGPRGRSHRFR